MTDDEAAAACAMLAAPDGGHAALACLMGGDDANPAPPGLWRTLLDDAAPPRIEGTPGSRLGRVLAH